MENTNYRPGITVRELERDNARMQRLIHSKMASITKRLQNSDTALAERIEKLKQEALEGLQIAKKEMAKYNLTIN